MPKAKENPIYLHWDKAVLLLLAAVGVYVFLGRVVSSPIKVDGAGGSKKTPDQLVTDLVKDAEDLQKKIDQSNPPKPEPVHYADFLRDRLDETIPANLPRNPLTFQGAGVKELAVLEYIATPVVLSPVNVRGRAGIGLISTGSETRRSELQTSAPSGSETHWITVAAEFPFYQQYLAFAGLDPMVDKKRRLDANDQHFVFARVDLQRQELQADGSWSKAEDINAYQLYRETLPTTVENLAKLYSLSSNDELPDNARALKDWLSRDGFQEFIVRPEFFHLMGFEQWHWPEDQPDLEDDRAVFKTLAGELPRDETPKYRDVSRRPAAERSRANALVDRPDLMGGLPGQVMPSTQPRTERTVRSEPGSTMRVRTDRVDRIKIPQNYRQDNAPETIQMWAHDSTVVPGSTYRYRMRVLLFNPLCGHELASSSKARTVGWLEGPWSGWSEPVEAFKKQLFYFTGVSPARGSTPPRARVTVYAWQDGWWYENLFFYSDVGSMIGSRRDVPHFVMGEPEAPARAERDVRGGTSRRAPPAGPGPRPRVSVDFTTGWSILGFKPEVQLDQTAGDESGTSDIVTTAELEVKEQTTERVEKRYVIIDSDDAHRQKLADIVARQEAAFRQMQRDLDDRQPNRTERSRTPSLTPGGGVPDLMRR